MWLGSMIGRVFRLLFVLNITTKVQSNAWLKIQWNSLIISVFKFQLFDVRFRNTCAAWNNKHPSYITWSAFHFMFPCDIMQWVGQLITPLLSCLKAWKLSIGYCLKVC
jgi:hypothetical protein